METHNGQLLLDFHNTFSQLIAQILTEPLEHVRFIQLV